MNALKLQNQNRPYLVEKKFVIANGQESITIPNGYTGFLREIRILGDSEDFSLKLRKNSSALVFTETFVRFTTFSANTKNAVTITQMYDVPLAFNDTIIIDFEKSNNHRALFFMVVVKL